MVPNLLKWRPEEFEKCGEKGGVETELGKMGNVSVEFDLHMD